MACGSMAVVASHAVAVATRFANAFKAPMRE